MYNDVYGGGWSHGGYSENRFMSPECYAGLNMTDRHQREDFGLWTPMQGVTHEMTSPNNNTTAGTMWDSGYMDYYKWKTSNHAPTDHNLGSLPWPRKDILRDGGRQITNSQAKDDIVDTSVHWTMSAMRGHLRLDTGRDYVTAGGLGHDGINHGQDIHRASASSTGSFGRGSSTGSLSNTSTPTNTPNTPLVVPQPVKPNRTGKTYQCKMCDQELLGNQIFSTKSDMMIHCQQIHKQDPKPYKCPTCSKCFANSSYLSQHNRIHTGIKPYKCEICERKFTQLSHLQQHIRTHTGEKPYKCMHPGCGKAFSQLSNLQSHSRSHMTDKPYRCNSCYKCYADEQSLREHIPKHSDTKHLKTHICHICGKSYTQETYLTRHMAKHSNESHKIAPRPIKTEPMDPADRDYGRMSEKSSQDGPLGGACSKSVSSAFMPLPQFGPNVSSSSNSSYPYGPSLSSNSLSSPLPHISSMTSPRYFPYDPIGFRKSDPPERNLNVPMTPRDSMIANSLLSLQHIKNYASQQMPSFTPTCTSGSRLT